MERINNNNKNKLFPGDFVKMSFEIFQKSQFWANLKSDYLSEYSLFSGLVLVLKIGNTLRNASEIYFPLVLSDLVKFSKIVKMWNVDFLIENQVPVILGEQNNSLGV